ncbi:MULTISPECIES: hypothetical protein [Halorussus]|uniref:hypothetical protein n=1 Tax=Halorussus TaxID=1070314 RepID=UPI00209D7857|nr:hypothetical protein [Halorussus vallis]USZ75888.1 hypothetical protein NGM07_00865 [Halorussus vallis]
MAVSLSGCSRSRSDDEAKVGTRALVFRNSDSLPHDVGWTLRYLGSASETTEGERTEDGATESETTERGGEVEATATVSLEAGESRTFSGVLDEQGAYGLDVVVRGSELRFDFEYPSDVNGTPVVYGVEVNEEGTLGQISMAADVVD